MLAVAGVLLALAAVAIAAGARLLLARSALLDARRELRAARTLAASNRADDARQSLDRAERRIRDAGRNGRAFPLGAFRPVPLAGSPARALAATTSAALDAVTAGRVVVEEAQRFSSVSTGASASGTDLGPLHDAALTASAAIPRAEELLARARQRLAGPVSAALPQISGAARAMRTEVDDAVHHLDSARRGLSLFADISAPSTDMRLLVISQDSLELRPTGGYIGSFGVVHVAGGVARLERYDASEDLPPARPDLSAPADLAQFLPGPWRLSNANWWPDFPTSAAAARDLFNREGGDQVDGVLALTELAIARLVGALGQVTVPGYSQPVVEQGFDDRVLYEVERKVPLDVPRKKFLINLATALFDRLGRLTSGDVPKVTDAVAGSVGAGDVQLWFADTARQDQLRGTVIAGHLPEASRDFLMVVDANVTASKANVDLVKQIDYAVTVDDRGRLAARLVVRVVNTSAGVDIRDPYFNPFYNGFLRVYVPQGSRLTGPSDGVTESKAPDGPYSVLARRFVVRPGESQTLTFDYVLPRTVVDGGRYNLRWARQPGTPRDALRADISGRKVALDPAVRESSIDRKLPAGLLSG